MSSSRLAELTEAMLERHAASLPQDFTENMVCWSLAALIISQALGHEFMQRELLGDGRINEIFATSKKEVHVIYLADLIWRLRHTSGFDVLLIKNGSSSLESTYFELSAAEQIRSVSESVEFVVPSGVRGRDYDMRAFGYLGFPEAAIEFKCRRAPFTSERTLENFLKDVRSQFPSDGTGVLHVFIPTVEQQLSQQQFIKVISAWLSGGTSRVKRVVVHWDQVPDVTNSIVRVTMTVGPHGIMTDPKRRLRRAREWVVEIGFLKDIGRSLRPINPQCEPQSLRWNGLEVVLGRWSTQNLGWWRPNDSGFEIPGGRLHFWRARWRKS